MFLYSVCFGFSDSTIAINTTSAEILDERNSVKCNIGGMSCLFQCTFKEELWFSGSYYCLEADVETSASGDKVHYYLTNCKYTIFEIYC